ncbi:3-dehydroquinate synthase [endosymbiont of Pachyrhynchus infernalis]|uniref:3-dehydroquinate synthase n=1 Tax=endosymbiont of Pachyrhynchus infernalis TaxID=1971488 RepID=UPI000DC730D4|nr:3-dehydroquinate synthase [endosymbiont of Pachyrhynchus infernalis]BBA84874.1 3-dehydroquinate synthase [endosymbiont of Pachyrhynchus infernalis]
MKIINVKLDNINKYKIIIDYKLFEIINSLYPINKNTKVMIITNNFLKTNYENYFYKKLNELNIKYNIFLIPDGESSKSLNILNLILTEMLNNNMDRNSILISFGGGVIGDITGFSASIYQRGIKFIQIPTTLLSQIDSSIGGKTGINHILGKNMIGSFHQPSSVFIDIFFLKTLPKREISSGLAEAIKYSIIYDKKFFIWLENNIEKILNLDIESLKYCIYKCCKIKSKIISKDEKENGIRSILNFGHTYGHAIEAFMGYGKWTHGESISAGMMISIETAIYLNNFSKKYKNRIKNLILKANLPIKGPNEMNPNNYIPYILKDKKNKNNKIKLIIPEKIGKAVIVDNIKKEIILNSINNNINN